MYSDEGVKCVSSWVSPDQWFSMRDTEVIKVGYVQKNVWIKKIYDFP